MKLEPVTKLDKTNKTTSKNFDDDFMSENCDVIVIFWIFGQFEAVWMPDSRHRVCKSYIFSNNNLLSYKNRKNRTKKYGCKLHMDVYLRGKFEVSSIVLTIFRQGGRDGGGKFPSPPTSKRTPKKPTQIRVKEKCPIVFFTKQLPQQ